MFKNEPLTDFTIAGEREKFASALTQVDQRIRSNACRAAPLVNGQPVQHGELSERFDPSDGVTKIGTTTFASVEDAERAVQTAHAAAISWGNTAPEERAKCLQNAANLMRREKMLLAALMVREVGKSWREADADVAEAIDFCDYYAAEMIRLGKALQTEKVPGEDNTYFYQPRGVCAVIAPWNFPLAIACGMAVAGLVTGNAVILKPAEQSNLIAAELVAILHKSGIPVNALGFLPGRGETVGKHLVEHPLVDMIVFTGSKTVGLEIIRSASILRPRQRNIKKVVAELGGKNAVIVDEDADLDEAIKGVLYSAFGFSGQKCSACSRLIGVGVAYEPLLKRLCEAARSVLVGAASNPATIIGPVIDQESRDRIVRTIEAASQAQKLAFRGEVPSGEGSFAPPTIFRDVDPRSSIWREEIFGPVIAAVQAPNFDEALRLANDSEYALTGGLFSRSPAHIERAKREFKVGNLYINRGCTGALVCRQPFGGFRMSGIGSKAGGPDYLIQFMEPRTISENTMRRGFAPA